MRKNLLKTLLVAVGLVMGVNAWADVSFSTTTINETEYNVKTIDFTSWSGDLTLTTGSDYCNIGKTALQNLTAPDNLSNYIALQGAGNGKGNGWWLRNLGYLYSYGAGRSGAIKALPVGAIIEIYTSNTTFATTSGGAGAAEYTEKTFENGISAEITKAGDIGFSAGKNAQIKKIIIYTISTGVEKPTGNITGVNGKSRTATFQTLTIGAKLLKSDTKDGEYTEFDGTITVSETQIVYVKATLNDKESEVLEYTIEAGTEIELNKPTYSITNIANGYNKTFSIACNNDDILLKPTATLTYSFLPTNGGTEETGTVSDNTINATQAGTYTITANAEGYTSSSITIDNNTAYTSTKVIDITAITKDELSTNWTLLKENSNLPGNSNQWPNKYPDVIADEYFYNFSSETASSTDIIDGLNIEYTANGKTPMLYTGFGLMYPIYELNTDGATREENKVAINTGKVSVADATSEQYCIYTYINNYGKNGTKKSVLQGNESYNLYRYSDVLTKVEVYSPATTVSIGEAGLATYCNPTVGLDFTNAENIEAYKATVDAGESTVILTKVNTVAAGEGVLLRSIAGDAATENIPVAADAQKNDGNDFVGVETDIESLATKTDGHTNYILNNVDGVIGFYKAAGNSVAAGKAYLQVPTTAANAKSLKIVFGDTTGISEINNTAKADGAYYSISGVRVANPTKGLYIQNGKKVIVK